MFNETNASPSYHTLIINVLTRITRARKTKREGKYKTGGRRANRYGLCINSALHPR